MEMLEDGEKVDLDSIPTCFPDLTNNKEDKYLLLGAIKYINGQLEDQWMENKENKNSRKGVKEKSKFQMGH